MNARKPAPPVYQTEGRGGIIKRIAAEHGVRSIAHLTGDAMRKLGIETPLADFLHGDLTGGRVRAAMAPPCWWRPRA